MITLSQLKEDGSLNALKWMGLFMILFFFIGYLFAVIKVVYFEQTDSGQYAIHNECVYWDEPCIRSCEDAQFDNPRNPPSCAECCLRYKDQATPIGLRIRELGKRYGLVASSIGMVVGLTISEEKRKNVAS
jgi:hypothetical protein